MEGVGATVVLFNADFTQCVSEQQSKMATVAWVLPKYTLTRICYVEYMKRVESVFEIIAEPNRRAILSLLVSSQQSVGEIERQLRMTQPTVSKHLRVLREAGFVESTVDAQRRLYRLKPEPLKEIDTWLAQFRRFWSAHVDALERHLNHIYPSTPTKTKTKKTTRPKPRK
jgi:DNA-binding transcriptional ArsR family regulator